MNGRTLRIGLPAATALALAIGALVLISTHAWAQGPVVAIGEASANPGEQVSVDLTAADLGAPGLGAWSIDVSYDPSAVTAVSCEAVAPGATQVCNEAYADDTVRAAGAHARGLEGDVTVVRITFECADEEGTSSLSVDLVHFADATVGDPQPIAADVDNGAITCSSAPPPRLPETGLGGRDDRVDMPWVIAALSVAGLAWLAIGFRARRHRA